MGQPEKLSNIAASMNMRVHPRTGEPAPAPRRCAICGASVPPLLTVIGHWVPRRCECEREQRRKEHEHKEHKARMKQMAIHTYGGWLGKAWIDPAFIHELGSKRFDTYDVVRQREYEELTLAFTCAENDSDRKEYNELLESFEKDRATWRNALMHAKKFAQNPQGVIIFHSKEYGVGKSHLLAAICNEQRHKNPPTSSLFVVTPRFFSAFYDRMEHKTEWELIQQACTTPLLVFDDLDKAGPKEFRREIFYQIIDERITAKRPIAISTNKMNELANYVGPESYSRLMVGCKSVEISGEDYRLMLK